MTPVEYVQAKAGTTETPTLETSDVEAIVERAARPDPDGNQPFSDDWQPTYDLNAAVAEALEERAAKVLTRFSVTVDGQTMQRQQMYQALMSAAKMYRNRTLGRIRKDRPSGRSDPRGDVILGGG